MSRARKPERKCSVDGCDKKHLSRGFCNHHYQRWRKHGDPNMVPPNLGNRTPRPKVTVRICIDCGHTGEVADFHPGRNICTRCYRARSAAWRIANPDKVAAQRARDRIRVEASQYELRRRAERAGLDPDMFVAYYEAHDGRCEICGGPPVWGKDLALDHNHETGAFRGMLCGPCNNALGLFKDSIPRLLAAIAYLHADGKSPTPVTPGDLAWIAATKPWEKETPA